MGSYEELLASSSSFNHLLEDINQQEEEEHELSTTAVLRRSSRNVTLSEPENDEILSSSTNFEMKQEGSINWRVYISYMRAGAGLVLTLILLIVFYGVHEATSIFYSWWLAKWSDDESHRYRHLNNCTGASSEIVNTIRSMNDTEWNHYRERRFHIYSGLFM
jgi:hypothetical protein